MVGPENKELFEAELEIEELAMQLADMLGVALYYAGIEKKDIPEAVDVYLNAMDGIFENSDEIEYGFEEVVKVIEHVRTVSPQLFTRSSA
jgi:Na+/phosphate symporter